jgi:hypothetical protein
MTGPFVVLTDTTGIARMVNLASVTLAAGGAEKGETFVAVAGGGFYVADTVAELAADLNTLLVQHQQAIVAATGGPR